MFNIKFVNSLENKHLKNHLIRKKSFKFLKLSD